MGDVGLDRTRPLTGDTPAARGWCGRPATCSSAMGPPNAPASCGGEGSKENGNTRVVVISRWRTLESRSQPMLLNTETSSEAIGEESG
jgi:hypothetical protein